MNNKESIELDPNDTLTLVGLLHLLSEIPLPTKVVISEEKTY